MGGGGHSTRIVFRIWSISAPQPQDGRQALDEDPPRILSTSAPQSCEDGGRSTRIAPRIWRAGAPQPRGWRALDEDHPQDLKHQRPTTTRGAGRLTRIAPRIWSASAPHDGGGQPAAGGQEPLAPSCFLLVARRLSLPAVLEMTMSSVLFCRPRPGRARKIICPFENMPRIHVEMICPN